MAVAIDVGSTNTIHPTNKRATGFELAGADRVWKPATARIAGDKVVVSSSEVKQPVAARYAWHADPKANLYNEPVSPLRLSEQITGDHTRSPIP